MRFFVDFPLLNQFVQQLERKPVTLGAASPAVQLQSSPPNKFPTREQLIGRGSLRFDDPPEGGAGVASPANGESSFQVHVRSDSGQVAPGIPVV